MIALPLRPVALSLLMALASLGVHADTRPARAALGAGPSPQGLVASAPNGVQSWVIDLGGQASMDLKGDPDNQRLSIPLGAGAVIVGLGWDLVLSTNGASWLSEVFIDFGASQPLRPAEGDDFSGSTMNYSSGGLLDLVSLGLSFSLGADGLLQLELYELSDDLPNAADARYLPGSKITVAYVSAIPEPAPYGLLALGLAGIGLYRRRTR